MKALTNSQMALLIQEKVQNNVIEVGRDFTYYDTDIKKERKDILCKVVFSWCGNVCKVALQLYKIGWVGYRELIHTDRKKIEKLIREIQ